MSVVFEVVEWVGVVLPIVLALMQHRHAKVRAVRPSIAPMREEPSSHRWDATGEAALVGQYKWPEPMRDEIAAISSKRFVWPKARPEDLGDVFR